jgi:hypothetical protein
LYPHPLNPGPPKKSIPRPANPRIPSPTPCKATQANDRKHKRKNKQKKSLPHPIANMLIVNQARATSAAASPF